MHGHTRADKCERLSFSLFQGAQDYCHLQICETVCECARGSPALPPQAVITHPVLGHQKCTSTHLLGQVIRTSTQIMPARGALTFSMPTMTADIHTEQQNPSLLRSLPLYASQKYSRADIHQMRRENILCLIISTSMLKGFSTSSCIVTAIAFSAAPLSGRPTTRLTV